MPDDFDAIWIGIQLDRAEECGAIETDVAEVLRGLVRREAEMKEYLELIREKVLRSFDYMLANENGMLANAYRIPPSPPVAPPILTVGACPTTRWGSALAPETPAAPPSE